MNEKLLNVKLSKIAPHNTRYNHVYAPAGTLYSQKGYPRLTAYCVL